MLTLSLQTLARDPPEKSGGSLASFLGLAALDDAATLAP
jgi:hypothetical protein